MTARSISKEAYARHIESGKRDVQWVKIYRYIASLPLWPKTRSELSMILDIRMSSVCGRVNELIKAGLLVELGRRECRITKEPAHTLTIRS